MVATALSYTELTVERRLRPTALPPVVAQGHTCGLLDDHDLVQGLALSIGGRIAKRPSKVTSTGAPGCSRTSEWALSRAALSASWATGSDVRVRHSENQPASAI
jgi:hypothetical protein